MQHFRLMFVGGIRVDVVVPDDSPVTAAQVYKYVTQQEVDSNGWIIYDDGLVFDKRALLGIEKVFAQEAQ